MTDKASPAVIACPPFLTGPAAERWSPTIRALARARTLSAEVLPLVERYCLAYGRWREAEERLATEGAVVPAPKSNTPMQNPWVSIGRAAGAQLQKLEAELALAPARRGRAARALVPLGADGKPARPDAWDRMAGRDA